MSWLPRLGPRGEGWFVLQLVLLALIMIAGWQLGGSWYGAAALLTTVSGLGLMVVGALTVANAVLVLGPALSPLPRPSPRGELVQMGPYGHVRHPIYAGVLLAALGFALFSASLAALLLWVALAVLLDLKARLEEAWLTERYSGYGDYARRTRRFVPGLY